MEEDRIIKPPNEAEYSIKDVTIKERKEYKLDSLKLKNVILDKVTIEKIIKDDPDSLIDIQEYNIFIKFNKKDVKIATIRPDGTIEPNRDLLEDEQFTEDEKRNLGDMLNLLGLEQGKINLDKLQEKLEENEKQQEKGKTEKKSKEAEKEEKEKEEEQEELGDKEREQEEKTIAKRKNISEKNICKIRRDSQFYKNYPNIPKTAYFYLDENNRMHAEYIDKDGSIKELRGFQQMLDRPIVTSFGSKGDNIRDELPYRVMTARGLEDKNHNTQDIRIAIYKDVYGYLRIETIHQGRNGEWEGKAIDTYGRERDSTKMNRIIDEKHKTPLTGVIARRHEELKQSGYSQDGITFDELSKKRKIEEYVKDGYTYKEANQIYDYVVGEMQLKEEDAKVKVSEEREKKYKEEDQKTPWGDAEARRERRH